MVSDRASLKLLNKQSPMRREIQIFTTLFFCAYDVSKKDKRGRIT